MATKTKKDTSTKNTTLLTQEGLTLLQNELEHLKTVERDEVANKLKEAISYGDLSENAEYDHARSEQARIEIRISEIEEVLKNYTLIDTAKRGAKKSAASVGSEVTVISLLEDDENESITFRIVGSTESNIFEGKVSNESPMGSAIIGKEVGEIVRGKAPSGTFEYRIESIK